jgi:antitoxin MazE
MQATIRPIGNSLGIVIPRVLLKQLDLGAQVELTVEDGALVLRRPPAPARAGWREAARAVAAAGDDALVLGEFGNADDEAHRW